MATYIYKTIPQSEGEEPEYFEIQQSMKDAPLTHHPVNGKPVHRVITGGYGVINFGGESPASPSSSGHKHTGSCGCGAGGCGN
jgi:predicted nucleic acid-binding Zn ribbon protein